MYVLPSDQCFCTARNGAKCHTEVNLYYNSKQARHVENPLIPLDPRFFSLRRLKFDGLIH